MGIYYWTPYHQDLVEQFYYAQFSGATSGITRNKIINLLYPVLVQIANKVLWALGWCTTDKNIQDENVQICVIRMSTHLLPRLQQERLPATLRFLYRGTRWYLINDVKKVRNKIKYEDINKCDIVASDGYNADDNINKEDINRQILRRLDRKIQHQRILNKTATIFLINMKEYLINNNMDPRGFREYVMLKMNIKETTYSSIISRCGIGRKLFNEQIIQEKKKIKKK